LLFPWKRGRDLADTSPSTTSTVAATTSHSATT